MINAKAENLTSSRAYSPLGFAPEAVFFGVPIRKSCGEVIRCPEDQSQPG